MNNWSTFCVYRILTPGSNTKTKLGTIVSPYRIDLSAISMICRARRTLQDSTEKEDLMENVLPAADDFEFAMPATTTATGAGVDATAQIGESIYRAKVAHRVVCTVMKNKYAHDPGKQAAWLSASNIEKAPKKSVIPAPPTP
jgi:hypothetical protein